MRSTINITSHPMGYVAQPPSGAPPHAELLGAGILVAWIALRGGLAKKHAKAAKPLVAREITGREFLVRALKGKLVDTDVTKQLAGFLVRYTHRGSEREEAFYPVDYLAAFEKVVKNAHHVPDTWAAYERMAPILDTRYADYQLTKLVKPPPKGFYDKAIKARNAVKVDAPKVEEQKIVVDAGFTDLLLSIVGRPIGDQAVKDILTVAGLPIGKRTDEQALPALGVSYMGSKYERKQLEVDDVCFYAKGATSYIRGIGAKVEFAQYGGALPHGVVWKDDRATVRKKISKVRGKPSRDDDEYLEWEDKQRRYLQLCFSGKKLLWVRWSMPRAFEG
jgi:hypothetical protein